MSDGKKCKIFLKGPTRIIFEGFYFSFFSPVLDPGRGPGDNKLGLNLRKKHKIISGID